MRFLYTAIASLLALALPIHALSPLSALVFSPNTLCQSMVEDAFTAWMKQYDKAYSFAEFSSRFEQFQANLESIRKHNTETEAAYKLDLNQFADLSPAEFKAKYLGLRRIEGEYLRSKNLHHPVQTFIALPPSIDWRTQGAVSPVPSEADVPQSWAVSAAGAIEGAWVVQGQHSLVSVPAQQLVDCCTNPAGTVDATFECAIKAGGVCASYSKGQCNSCERVIQVSGFKDIASGDESALQNAVATIGPVSVAVEADGIGFQFYTGGVYSGSCGTQVDHSVLVVGYGTDNGADYWIVKNSWGSSWGENGYIRLIRNKNECGIALSASYPTV